MSNRCGICGKGSMVGHNVSHSHRRTKRRFYPNLQLLKVKTKKGNKRILVCSRCLRSQKVEKAG